MTGKIFLIYEKVERKLKKKEDRINKFLQVFYRILTECFNQTFVNLVGKKGGGKKINSIHSFSHTFLLPVISHPISILSIDILLMDQRFKPFADPKNHYPDFVIAINGILFFFASRTSIFSLFHQERSKDTPINLAHLCRSYVSFDLL